MKNLDTIVANPIEFKGLQWNGEIDVELAEWIGRPFSAWKWDSVTDKNTIELKFGTRRKYINKGDWILQTPENFIIVVQDKNFAKRYSVTAVPTDN